MISRRDETDQSSETDPFNSTKESRASKVLLSL
jgi:hypothetical protein